MQLDHIGSAKMATDWGARIIANDSELYDPLSYHHGSVWGLFTGWQSMAAYKYGRPHIGYQALMANSLLTYTDALGYVTELLSGDFNAPFGRSSHHQVWSEAMVISPLMRGMLGLEISNAGKTVKFAPNIPANWDNLDIKGIRTANSMLDLKLTRASGKLMISATQTSNDPTQIILASSFPLDAEIKKIFANGKKIPFEIKSFGDGKQAEVKFDLINVPIEISFEFEEGTEVYLDTPNLVAGAESMGLRIVRSQARKDGLFLILEGRGNKNYQLNVRTPRRLKEIEGVKIISTNANEQTLQISFDGDGKTYVKREILLSFSSKRGN